MFTVVCKQTFASVDQSINTQKIHHQKVGHVTSVWTNVQSGKLEAVNTIRPKSVSCHTELS